MGSSIDFLGIAAMALIVLLASLTVAGVIYGMRLKRRRVAAEHELVERRETIDQMEVPQHPANEVEKGDDAPVAAKPDAANVDADADADSSEASDLQKTTSTPADKAPKRAKPSPVGQTSELKPATPSVPPAPEPLERGSPAEPAETALAGTGEITQLKGLGPKLAATLAQLGYTRIDQIATLTPEDASALDARLGAFQGRMARDKWIEQAKLLSAGDRAGYEAQFGKLG